MNIAEIVRAQENHELMLPVEPGRMEIREFPKPENNSHTSYLSTMGKEVVRYGTYLAMEMSRVREKIGRWVRKVEIIKNAKPDFLIQSNGNKEQCLLEVTPEYLRVVDEYTKYSNELIRLESEMEKVRADVECLMAKSEQAKKIGLTITYCGMTFNPDGTIKW